MKNYVLQLVVVGSLLLTTACGNDVQADPSEAFSIREARPTFTPTLGPNAPAAAATTQSDAAPAVDALAANMEGAANTAASPTAAGAAPANTPPANPSPATTNGDTAASDAAAPNPNIPTIRVVVNTQLVNARQGPSTDFPVVGIVGRGEEYEVIGRNAAGDWWNVCCYEEQEFWIINELVDTIDDVDPAAIAVTAPQAATSASAPNASPTSESATSAAAQAVVTATPTPAAIPALGTTDSDGFDFELKLLEQFPETEVVRIFLYVFNAEVQALDGYSLRVTKDGVELPVDATSFGPQAGFTWPVAESRQRFQNFEMEFPGVEPGGTWVVQLVDGSGRPVGPPATFELSDNDPEQELYVRYEQQ